MLRLLPLIALASLLPAPALACEAGTCFGSSWPADGATAVPTDARLWVFYDIAGPDGLSARLLDAAGAEVPTTAEWTWSGDIMLVSHRVLVLTPTEPLLPQSAYTAVLDEPSAVCDSPALAFTTGDGPAAGAPEAVEVLSGEASFVAGAPAIGPCDVGPDRHHYALQVQGGGPTAVAWELLEDGEPRALWPGTTLVLDVEGTGEPPAACFTARALDGAGHPGPASAPWCWPPEAGDDDPPEAPEATGCGCATAAGPGGAALGSALGLLLGLLLVPMRRRR